MFKIIILKAFSHLASQTLVMVTFVYFLLHLFWPKDLLHLPFPLPVRPFTCRVHPHHSDLSSVVISLEMEEMDHPMQPLCSPSPPYCLLLVFLRGAMGATNSSIQLYVFSGTIASLCH